MVISLRVVYQEKQSLGWYDENYSFMNPLNIFAWQKKALWSWSWPYDFVVLAGRAEALLIAAYGKGLNLNVETPSVLEESVVS